MLNNPRTIGRALEDAAQTTTGLWHVDERGAGHFVSYAELLADARALAGGLRASGFGPGARIGIAIGSTEAFVRTFFAAVLAGAVVTPLPEASVLRDPDGFTSHLEALVAGARLDLLIGDTRTVTLWNERPDVDGMRRPPAIEAAALQPMPDAPVGGADLHQDAIVQLSSGSTGQPKGIVLTHAAIDANVRGILRALDADGSDIGVSWLPLHHDMGLIGMLVASVYVGGTTVLLPPLAFVKRPALWLKVISQYRGTISFAPSSAYELAARRIRSRDLETLDLTCWRVAGCGGEPIDAQAMVSFAAVTRPCGFRPEAFTPCYGLAEHVVAAAMSPHGRTPSLDVVSGDHLSDSGTALPCPASDPSARRLVSCGYPLARHELVVADETGRMVPERTVGEIVLCGPSIMRGYLQADGTVEPIEDGALRTGDLGYVADGELYICGRKKETIIRAGRNYDPHEIERTVSMVEPLRATSVIAFGSTPFAAAERVVVALESTTDAPADIPALVRQAVMSRCSVAVDEVLVCRPRTLPETTSGKPRRLAFRERYERGELANEIRYRG